MRGVRFVRELLASPPRHQAELRVRDGVIDAHEGEPLDTSSRWDAVQIAENVYARISTAEARVRLLEHAKRLSRGTIVVHVPVTPSLGHAGRIAIDLPRRALRAIGVDAPEPGDRFAPRFVHAFFDEEPLYREFDRAGLAVASRRGSRFVLERATSSLATERPEAFVFELVRAARLVRRVERARLHDPPERVLATTRARGADAKARGPVGRARLRRAIAWVDALGVAWKSAPNCYRRTLLELALDGGAAREPIVFGLDVGRTGHVAFKDREDFGFDVVFEIP